MIARRHSRHVGEQEHLESDPSIRLIAVVSRNIAERRTQ